LRCVRRCGGRRRARSRSGTGRNYRSDGFALGNWLGCCHDGRLAVIDSGKLLAILGGLFAMLNLGGHRRNALLAGGGEFRGSRLASDAAGSVVAGAGGGVIDGGVVDDRVGYGAVVDLYVGGSDVVDGAIIVEAISTPVSALVTSPGVAISIINAAVVADVRAPVAVVIAIAVAAISPPSGRPQISDFGWTGPTTWNPVVTL